MAAARPHADSVLAVNLRRLIDRQAGGSVNGWCKAKKLNQSTINRLVTGDRDATTSLLQEIATATGYAAWQLLHPDFDPAHMPPALDAQAMRMATIYAAIRDPKDKRRAEAIMEQFADADVPSTQPATHAHALGR